MKNKEAQKKSSHGNITYLLKQGVYDYTFGNDARERIIDFSFIETKHQFKMLRLKIEIINI